MVVIGVQHKKRGSHARRISGLLCDHQPPGPDPDPDIDTDRATAYIQQ